MEHIDKKIKSKLLKVAHHHFPGPYISKDISKYDENPYSYWVGWVKMYVFNETDILQFMNWYWNNDKLGFQLKLYMIDYNIQYKYFCNKISNFKTNYPTVKHYEEYILDNGDVININKLEELINLSGGIDNFIIDVIKFKNRYKIMGFKKTSNIYFCIC